MSDDNNNLPRKLTLVVTVDDPEASRWIWENHLKNEAFHGVKIDRISSDDMLTKLEDTLDRIEGSLCLE